ncbi:MAG: ABC-F family ATP-binding cassette domain-containing protein [Mycobacteriales bacterium]
MARDVVKTYPTATGVRRVLDGVSLTLTPGRRTGLVGENGAGKSTLLRLLAGLESADTGEITRPGDIGFLDQQPVSPPGGTVRGVVDEALSRIRDTETRLDQLARRLRVCPDDAVALAGYGAALDWAQEHELWDADRRARRVLATLGLGDVDPARPLATLSGGERSRLGLAALLMRRPGALLLDEPTNHLDDAALDFVQAELAGAPGVVVLASHDRVFLDAVCTDICDLDPTRHGATVYGGSYTGYLAAKRAERARWERQFSAEQEELTLLRRAVHTTAPQVAHGRAPRDNDTAGYKFHGSRVEQQVARRVRNARQRLDELTRTQVRKPPAALHLRARLTDRAGGDGPAIALRGLRICGRLRLDRLDVQAPGRLLVTGTNGAGKSTLLEVLAGRLAPESGSVLRRRGLRVGYLPQEVCFGDPRRTAGAVYADVVREDSGLPRLDELGLLAPRDMTRPVDELSVGQRRRLDLATVIASAPDLLLLDEPTNHLSLLLVDELENALDGSPGGVVIASHDRWLRRHWAGAELRLEPRAT